MDLLTAAVLILAGLAVAYAAHRGMRGPSTRRAFRKLPITTLAEAPTAGPYRFSGTVIAIGEPPVSEASGRPYVARDLRIVAGDEPGGNRLVRQAVDFLLDDGTGRALVRAQDSAFALKRDFDAPRTMLDQVPWVDALLRAANYYNGSPARCPIRLYEGVLAPGARAGVVGHVAQADALAASLGASRVVYAGPGTTVMLRAEAPGPAAELT
jgi:hypothetical protein